MGATALPVARPMISTRLLRLALWTTAPANFAVAALLLVPGSAAGRLLGLPAQVPMLYAALLALFVALFGATYVWLALQAEISRPLLALGALGKFLAFLITAALWAQGLAPDPWAALFIGDLLLAAVFAAWLRGPVRS